MRLLQSTSRFGPRTPEAAEVMPSIRFIPAEHCFGKLRDEVIRQTRSGLYDNSAPLILDPEFHRKSLGIELRDFPLHHNRLLDKLPEALRDRTGFHAMPPNAAFINGVWMKVSVNDCASVFERVKILCPALYYPTATKNIQVLEECVIFRDNVIPIINLSTDITEILKTLDRAEELGVKICVLWNWNASNDPAQVLDSDVASRLERILDAR